MITFMNNRNKCICCGGRPKKMEGHIPVNGKPLKMIVSLIKHHVKYNPEVVGWVHPDCHIIIHNENDPRYKHLIQYEAGESRQYYAKK